MCVENQKFKNTQINTQKSNYCPNLLPENNRLKMKTLN